MKHPRSRTPIRGYQLTAEAAALLNQQFERRHRLTPEAVNALQKAALYKRLEKLQTHLKSIPLDDSKDYQGTLDEIRLIRAEIWTLENPE
jgi:hypothetical protein